jgi:peptidyl-tRNA hydrolase
MDKEQAIEFLKQEGLEVLTKDDIEKTVQERVKSREFEIKLGIENDVKALVGIDKNPNEKTHEYIKRTFNDLKEKSTANVNKTVEEVQKAFFEKETALKNELEEYKNKVEVSKKESIFDKEFNQLQIDDNIDRELIELKYEKVKRELLNKVKIDGNNIFILKEDGDFERDKDDNMQIVTLQKRLAKELGKYLKKENPANGTGKKPIDGQPSASSDVEKYVLSKSPKSDAEILKHVQDFYIQKDMNPRSADATKSFSELSKKLAIK